MAYAVFASPLPAYVDTVSVTVTGMNLWEAAKFLG
jgi:hypothetical protein